MGISKRATGVNLLNHIIQKKLLDNLQTTYVQRGNYEGEPINSAYFRDKQSWIFTFSYVYQGNQYTYTYCGRSKKEATTFTLEKASEHLSSIIHHT